DLLFTLLLAGAISSAFIPVLSEHLAKNERQRALEIGQRVLNAGVVILTIGAAVLFVVAPLYVSLIAFGYSAGDHELITKLTRVLLLQPIFLGAGGMVIGILTAYQRFFAQALAPLFYNISIIVAAAWFAPQFGVGALAVGVVIGAALRYADTIAQLPLGTFSQALAFVLFPFLARDAALQAIESIRHRTSLALRLNIFVLVPASVGLAVLGVLIVALLFERGQFGPESVRETAIALTFFSLGLAGQAATALLVRVFYALQDVMTPLRISLVVIGVNLGTNVVLVHLLAQGGLALGTSIAATLDAILLGAALRGRRGGLEGPAIVRTVRRALIGGIPRARVVAAIGYGVP